jgi:hypothetical protein
MLACGFGRKVLGVCAVAALTACGGSQAQPAGSVPEGAAALALVPGKTLSEGKTQTSNLMYVVGGGERMYILSYPGGELIDSFSVTGPNELCSDGNGNVFLTLVSNQIAEYTHGGSTPVRILNDPGQYPEGCSVDPTTGALAVANSGYENGSNANVIVYPGGTGTAETFTDSSFLHFGFCGYDNSGNLFVSGTGPSGQFRLAELQKGSPTFTNITLNRPVVAGGGGSVQWDGKYMAVAAQQGIIYRTAGASGDVLGTVKLKSRLSYPFFWIQGDRIVAHYATTKLGLWRYPAGRAPISKIGSFLTRKGGFGGVTVSVAPKP